MTSGANNQLGQKLWWNQLHWFLAARKWQTFEKEEFSGPDAAQGEVLWWPGEHPASPGCTRGEREGKISSFIIITQENTQFCNNHSGKAGKYSDSVNNSLDMLPIVFFFPFQGWQLPRPSLVVTLHSGVQLSVIIYPSQPQPPVFFSMIWMVKSLASSVI